MTTYYCGRCKIHFTNSMGFFCPVCGEDKCVSLSRGNVTGVIST